jgi:hypothetical protein
MRAPARVRRARYCGDYADERLAITHVLASLVRVASSYRL